MYRLIGMNIVWALDMIDWTCAQPFPILAMPLITGKTHQAGNEQG